MVELLAEWVPHTEAAQDHLIAVERRNLALFGYGVKAFALSMIETAIEVSGRAGPGIRGSNRSSSHPSSWTTQ